MSEQVESRLVEAGVFKGMHGLEGLANADAFWADRTYGTRLYYGSGGLDYLHRSVLQSAIEILKKTPSEQETEKLKDAIKTVLDGFEKEVFIRNTVGDHKNMWAVEVLMYMQALATLAKFSEHESAKTKATT